MAASPQETQGAHGAGAAGCELAGARWPDLEAAPRRLLVVPVGSLEQHGPHLPLDTDTRIAVAVAGRACAGRAGVGLAPAFAIGASGEHADFPGTLSIGTEALTTCLIELGRHASLHWPAVLLVNGHGGNAAAAEAAVGRLHYEGRTARVWHAGLPAGDTPGGTPPGNDPSGQTEGGTRPGNGPGRRAEGKAPPGNDAHAGRFETSIMLALDPGAVRLIAAEPGDVRPVGQIMPELRERGVRAVSGNGVLGDPRGASAAEGERLLARLVRALNGVMDQLLAQRAG